MEEKTIKVNYKPLWKMLIDKNKTKGDLRRETKIAASTFTKMANNENVSLDVLVRICIALNCGLDDIVEIENLKYQSVYEILFRNILNDLFSKN